jgi:transposase-like protein
MIDLLLPAGRIIILAQRGVVVSYETIRRWCLKFGESFAQKLRRRRPQPGDKWYLDEVFIRIGGKLHYLWRAVDQQGVVLDVLVRRKRDGKAAKRFFKRLLKGLQYVPRVIVTDKLKSYGGARRGEGLACRADIDVALAIVKSSREKVPYLAPGFVGYGNVLRVLRRINDKISAQRHA